MQSTDTPSRIPLPFGASAGGGYIRTIPVASQIGVHDGWASFTDGFPPLNFQPVASGGVPPFGQDMNGILYQVSGWSRWQAGGGPVTYNSAFATAIGGYPKGAFLQSAVTPGLFFISTAENNTTDPDARGAGWVAVIPVKASGAQVTAGTDDATFVTPLGLAGLRASAAEVAAGSDAAKYVTPAALAAAGAFLNAVPGYVRLANGFKIAFGQYRATIIGEQAVNVGLPITFDAPPLLGLGNVWNDSGAISIDMWIQSRPQAYTTTTAQFFVAASSGGNRCAGFDWVVFGK